MGAVDKETLMSNYVAITSKTFIVSVLVETIGVLVFTFLGSAAPANNAAMVNGLALAIWIYAAANISGGHLNPAVTFSTLICGFYPLCHSILYIIGQIVGAILGALLVAGLMPGATVGMGDGAPGCFDSTVVSPKITRGQLFGWEVVMTFTLISVVYACGVAKPGHGSFTPLAVGLSLMACAGAGGGMTGAALNPARVIGPLAVFKCGQDVAWIYILAQLLAAVLACSIFAFVSGWGPLSPMTSRQVLGLSYMESMWMWVTGSPPKRFQHSGKENINDVMEEVQEARDSVPFSKGVLDAAKNVTDRFKGSLGGRLAPGGPQQV